MRLLRAAQVLLEEKICAPILIGRPAVIEVLCDECEKELSFSDFEETVRNELLLTLGAR